MARHRSYSIAFKRQVAQEYLNGGESLNSLAKRHDVDRTLIRLWVQRYEAGRFDEEHQAADLIQEYEGRIAALERMVGRLALENNFLSVWPAPSASGLLIALVSLPQRIRPSAAALAQMEMRAARVS